MRRTSLFLLLSFASIALAADGPVDRWAKAAGGREKLAAVKAIYREGTLEFAGMQGTIKVWHTAEGKYRKEEQIAAFSSVETCDGTNVIVRKGKNAPEKLEGAELAIEKSKAFANSNAMFYVFSPAHRDDIHQAPDGTIAFTPAGGVEWQVKLDPQTSLPAMMTHREGDKTITAELPSYETIQGMKFENEVRRSAGDGRAGAVIHFTKTILNPPVDAAMFTQ
jgi:hypothetical protein